MKQSLTVAPIYISITISSTARSLTKARTGQIYNIPSIRTEDDGPSYIYHFSVISILPLSFYFASIGMFHHSSVHLLIIFPDCSVNLLATNATSLFSILSSTTRKWTFPFPSSVRAILGFAGCNGRESLFAAPSYFSAPFATQTYIDLRYRGL